MLVKPTNYEKEATRNYHGTDRCFCDLLGIRALSPKAGFGKIVGNELAGSYTMSETWYYISLTIGIALAAYGVYKLITGK